MAVLAQTPVVAEATPVGALSAQLRRPRPGPVMSAQRRLQSFRTEDFFDLIDFLEGRWLWVLARYLDQVQPDADFLPAASRALYTLPRPIFSAVAMSVTERPALKSFTASSALSRADGLRPM